MNTRADLAAHAAVKITTDGAGRTVVRASGELDIANAPQLRRALLRAQVLVGDDVDGRPVVVDLSGVTFLDACALGVLVGDALRARRAGSEVVVRDASRRIMQVFAVTGLLRLFQMERDEQVRPAIPMPANGRVLSSVEVA